MDPEDTSEGEQPIDHVVVEEVPNSQISQNKELEYNPFVSQDPSQPGPSNRQFFIESGDDESSVEIIPAKRRRGRPPKDALSLLKPTRESQRQRKSTTVLNYESFHDLSLHWPERDQQLFLSGCMKVGIEDIEGLKRYLPHKTEHDIRRQIGMWKELASKRFEKILLEGQSEILDVKPKSIKNLDDWVDYFKTKTKDSSASTLVISNYFSYIAQYGIFPSPEKIGGIDVRAIYRYIHCMINGIPPYGLNKVTSTLLLTCIDNVLERLDEPDFIENMQMHLFDLTPKPVQFNDKYRKTYSKEVPSSSSEPVYHFLKNSVLNPLNLSESAVLDIMRAESDDDDDDDDSDEDDD